MLKKSHQQKQKGYRLAYDGKEDDDKAQWEEDKKQTAVQVRAYKRENDGLKRDIAEEKARASALQKQLDSMAGLKVKLNGLEGENDTLKRQIESEKQQVTSLQQNLATTKSQLSLVDAQLHQVQYECRLLREQATPTDAAALKQYVEQAKAQVHVHTCIIIVLCMNG